MLIARRGMWYFLADFRGGSGSGVSPGRSRGRMRGPGTWDPFTDDLGDKESAKSKCGKAHFEALAVGEAPARYIVANKFTDVLARV